MVSRGPFQIVLIFLLTVMFYQIAGDPGSGFCGEPGGHLPGILARIAPPRWNMRKAVKKFTSENLWDQINGRAEFFLSYDMVRMTFAGYTDSANPKAFIDVSIYDMGNPSNAFGVFSAERQEDITPVDLGREGYLFGANLFIWKGHYYVRMITSKDSPRLQKINRELAKKLVYSLDDSGESLWGLETLPKVDLVPGSERYFRRDAMGLDFMGNTYMAQYRKKGVLVSVFLLQKDQHSEAGEILARYAAYAGNFGKGAWKVKHHGVDITLCDMDGNYDVLFQKGGIVAGLTSIEDRKFAVDLALELWRLLPVMSQKVK